MYCLKEIPVRVSLRSSLLLFCLASIVLVYFADVKSRQNEVKKIVEELGGSISNVNFYDNGAVEPSRSAFLPDWFYIVLPEKYNYVYVTSPELDDAKLSQILRLPGIEGLNISWSSITDKGLLMLQHKVGIKEIQIYDIPTISEDAVLQLKSSTASSIQYRFGDEPPR